jgi:hypothetical protein
MKFTISTLLLLFLFSSTKLIFAGINDQGSAIKYISYKKTRFTPNRERELLNGKAHEHCKDKSGRKIVTMSDIKKEDASKEEEDISKRYEFSCFAEVNLVSDPYEFLSTASLTKDNAPIFHPEAFGVVRLLAYISGAKGLPLKIMKLTEHPDNTSKETDSDLLTDNYQKLVDVINSDLNNKGTSLDSLLGKVSGTIDSLANVINSDDTRLKPTEELITKNRLVSIVNEHLSQNRSSRIEAAKAINKTCNGKRMITNNQAFLNNPMDEKGSKIFKDDTFDENNIGIETINELFGQTDSKKSKSTK